MFTRFLIKPGAPQWLWVLGVLGDFLIFGGILFGLLQLVPVRFRRPLIVALTFIAGLIYSVEFFYPADPKTQMNFLTPLRIKLGEATKVVYAFALGLGTFNLIRFHGGNVIRNRAGWFYSLIFFISFFAMAGAGFWSYYCPSKAAENTYNMLFEGIVASLGATMFSTIGFYIVSAAYRAFRIRSAEATLMLLAAFIVMVGQVPVGAYITSGLPEVGPLRNLRLENLSYWILSQPNMAAQRGIWFGIEVGALAMALRQWLSLERGSFFEREL
ncbi:MAG: hypothetical protein QHH26_13305 [Armatimonadota bacterium]|nr:hypothetical protein [Armatimonadota bacterium]